MAVDITTKDIHKALDFVVSTQMGNKSALSQRIGVSAATADQLLDVLEQYGVVAAAQEGDLNREVLLSRGSAAVAEVRERISEQDSRQGAVEMDGGDSDQRGSQRQSRETVDLVAEDAREEFVRLALSDNSTSEPVDPARVGGRSLDSLWQAASEHQAQDMDPRLQRLFIKTLTPLEEVEYVTAVYAGASDPLSESAKRERRMFRSAYASPPEEIDIEEHVLYTLTGRNIDGDSIDEMRARFEREVAANRENQNDQGSRDVPDTSGEQDTPEDTSGESSESTESVEATAEQQSVSSAVLPEPGQVPNRSLSERDNAAAEAQIHAETAGAAMAVTETSGRGPGSYAGKNPMRGSTWRRWFDKAPQEHQEALREAREATDKAQGDFQKSFQTQGVFGRGKSREDRKNGVNAAHDKMARSMLIGVMNPLSQGVDINAVSNVATSMVVMYTLSPKMRSVVKDDVRSMSREYVDTARKRLGARSPKFFGSPKERAEASRRKNADLKNYDTRVKAMGRTKDRVPMGTDAAADTLLGLNDAAYDAMRTGEPADLVMSQHAETVSDFKKQWKKDGLVYSEIQDRALDKVAMRMKEDPGYAARYEQLAFGGVRPDTEQTKADGRVRWSGDWRRSRTGEKVRPSGDFFTPRVPELPVRHITGVGSCFAGDVARAGKQGGVEAMHKVMLGYVSATEAPSLLLGEPTTPGVMSDQVAASQRRARGMLQGVLEDGYSPQDALALFQESYSKALGVLDRDEPELMKAYREAHGATLDADVKSLIETQSATATVRRLEPSVVFAAEQQPEPSQDRQASVVQQQESQPTEQAQQTQNAQSGFAQERPNAQPRSLGSLPQTGDSARGQWSQTVENDSAPELETASTDTTQQTAGASSVTGEQPAGRWSREATGQAPMATLPAGYPRSRRVRPEGLDNPVDEQTVASGGDRPAMGRRRTQYTFPRDADSTITDPRSQSARTARVNHALRQTLEMDISDTVAQGEGGRDGDGGRTGQPQAEKVSERSHTAEEKQTRQEKVQTKSDQATVPKDRKNLRDQPSAQRAPVQIDPAMQTPAQRAAAERFNVDYSRSAEGSAATTVKIDYDDPTTPSTTEGGVNGIRHSKSSARSRREHLRSSFEKRNATEQARRLVATDPRAAAKKSKEFDLDL